MSALSLTPTGSTENLHSWFRFGAFFSSSRTKTRILKKRNIRSSRDKLETSFSAADDGSNPSTRRHRRRNSEYTYQDFNGDSSGSSNGDWERKFLLKTGQEGQQVLLSQLCEVLWVASAGDLIVPGSADIFIESRRGKNSHEFLLEE